MKTKRKPTSGRICRPGAKGQKPKKSPVSIGRIDRLLFGESKSDPGSEVAAARSSKPTKKAEKARIKAAHDARKRARMQAAWIVEAPKEGADFVLVPQVVRRTFGTAYAPLALVVAAIAAAGGPALQTVDADARTVWLQAKDEEVSLCPDSRRGMPWPRDRERDLVRALIAANEDGSYGLTPRAWAVLP